MLAGHQQVEFSSVKLRVGRADRCGKRAQARAMAWAWLSVEATSDMGLHTTNPSQGIVKANARRA